MEVEPTKPTRLDRSVVIVDYQMGNLRSVQKAIEKVGGRAVISADAMTIAAAERLILPGVGAFGDAMAELRSRDLVSPIVDYCGSGRPFLGICLGMQLLLQSSDEHGRHEGLGIVPGHAARFEAREDRKVPHMGWNTVTSTIDHPIAASVVDDSYFYFVHSYYADLADASWQWLRCDYQQTFTAAIAKDNVMATQFHPEKSQDAGMRLLSGFLAFESVAV